MSLGVASLSTCRGVRNSGSRWADEVDGVLERWMSMAMVVFWRDECRWRLERERRLKRSAG